MKVLFGMALRQTTGFVESLLHLIGLNWVVPDFSTLSRRQKTLAVNIPYRGSNGPLHLLIDSTGIKVEGEGEWNARKHGGPKRRVWRKIHLGIDEETLEVRAVEITGSWPISLAAATVERVIATTAVASAVAAAVAAILARRAKAAMRALAWSNSRLSRPMPRVPASPTPSNSARTWRPPVAERRTERRFSAIKRPCKMYHEVIQGGMIVSIRGKLAAEAVQDRFGKGFPADIVKRTRAMLSALDAAVMLEDLRFPPGNHLEALSGDRAGQHSVRINGQWRICFIWTDQGPAQVEIVDYH